MPARSPNARDVAAEIIRRAGGERYVVRLSDPIKPVDKIQLIAARLEGRSVAILPHKCNDIDDWLERYGGIKDR